MVAHRFGSNGGACCIGVGVSFLSFLSFQPCGSTYWKDRKDREDINFLFYVSLAGPLAVQKNRPFKNPPFWRQTPLRHGQLPRTRQPASQGQSRRDFAVAPGPHHGSAATRRRSSATFTLDPKCDHRTQAKLMNLEEAQEILGWCDSYGRMPKLIELYEDLEFEDWLIVLGEEWSGCDNIFEFLPELEAIFTCDIGPFQQMMNEEENKYYQELPDLVRIYRGCGEHNIRGACWTLDPEVAKQFPFQNRYLQANPLLVTAEVGKDHIVAVKLDRQEAEVITFDARVLSVDSLL